VLVDPPNFISSIFSSIFKVGAPAINNQLPSEFTRPWRFPLRDNQGDALNVELPRNSAGPYAAGMNANALFGAMPGSQAARSDFENCRSEAETIRVVMSRLSQGQHLGDPMDYAAYVIAQLTRSNLSLAEIANFNADADRGYGYLTWDWIRHKAGVSKPSAFEGASDPATGAPSIVSEHQYPTPAKPGYGWVSNDRKSGPPTSAFDPDIAQDMVEIRYTGHQEKFK
jgi:hypothetical protein